MESDTLPVADPTIPPPNIEYIGPKLPIMGALREWLPGLRALLTRGPSCYQALVCAGLSAGSWGSRLIAKRNPVIGLVDQSSRGKGSVINFALSVWMPPSWLTVPAGSTAKGLQDKAVTFPDWPIFADELQQLLDRDQLLVSDALYFLGNGQRRVTSSRDQTARGGDRRYGCGFFAAERPVTPGLNLGVQYRVWELDGPPLPYPDPDLAAVLQHSADHAGAPGLRLTRYMQQSGYKRPEWTAFLRDRLEIATATYGGLAGDDHVGLVLARWGLELLQIVGRQLVPDLTIPDLDVIDWLADRLKHLRSDVVDKELQSWNLMIDIVTNGERDGHRLMIHNEIVGWLTHVDGVVTALEINTMSPPLQQALARFGLEPRLVQGWGARGLIEKQGDHWKVRRRIEGSLGRVIRLTDAAIKKINRP